MEVVMKGTKSLLTLIFYAAIVASLSMQNTFADIPYSSSKKITECLKTWDDHRKCANIKTQIIKSYNYYKTKTSKGRNRKSSRWSPRKSVYKLRKFNNSSPSRNRTFKRPKLGGLRIDACVRGTGWKISDSRRCDRTRLKKIGNDFCHSEGLKRTIKILKESHAGKHAVLTYNKNRPKNIYWKRQRGTSAIKKIVCSR